MSQPQIEPLGGGLVLSRDASLLQDGELSLANDVHVKPGSPSLHKVPGRTAFNSTGLTAPTGLAYAPFETEDDRIIVVDGGSYKTASAAELTGTFSTLASDAGTSLEAVVLDDRVVLLSGADEEGASNVVLLSDGSSRLHGMLPVEAAPGATHTATGGTWPLGANDLGWFEYWTTELYRVGDGDEGEQEEVEGTFIGTPKTIEVTATTSHVVITKPELVNQAATHWKVYRSERKEEAAYQAFPFGWHVATIPIDQESFDDGLASTFSPTIATTGTSPLNRLKPYGTTGHVIVAWNDPTRVTTDDASLAVSGGVSFSSGGISTISQLVAGGFAITGINAPITNIKFTIEGSKQANTTVTMYVSRDGGVTYIGGWGVPLTTSNSTITIDAPTVSGYQWEPENLASGTFFVLLVASGRSVTPSTASIDAIKVGVTHNSSTAGLVELFPIVNLTISNVGIALGSNGHPPVATTGDIFQSSLLTNDVDNPTEVSWTIPGTIDYSPLHYSAVVGDVVKCIRTLGSAAIVGCAGSKVRMNFLPVAEDPEFNTGRCIEVYDTDDGAVSHKSMCRFTLAGEPRIFGIGSNNLWMTNGYTSTSATDDLIWTDLVNPGYLSLCVVENNVKHHELLVHYPAAGSESVNKTLRLSYHTSHLKDGKLKFAGITNYGPLDATSGIHSSGERRVYTLKGTKVYVENQGYTDGSGGTIVPNVSSRELHQAGHGSSWELLNVGVHHQGGGSTLSASVTSILSNYAAESSAPISIELTDRMLSIIDGASAGDGMRVNLTGEDDGNPLTIDYLVLFQEPLGETVPLKR